jgi:DNA-binding NarL/FixJ family response regulator
MTALDDGTSLMLLVDDSPLLRERLHAALSAILPVTVVGMVADPPVVVRAIDEWSPRCVLLDAGIGLRGGRQVLVHAQCKQPRVDVIVLSNPASPTMRRRFLGAGASAYFDKSMELDRLFAFLRALAPPGRV